MSGWALVIDPSVKSLRLLNRRLSYKKILGAPVIMGKALLMIVLLVNASRFFRLNSRNSACVKRDGDKEGRGCASRRLISIIFAGCLLSSS